MKKTTKITNVILGTLMVGFFALGFSSLSQNRDIEADAATVETKRVWLHTTYVSWWDGDLANALVGVHYWGGTSGSNWAGVQMSKDNANNLWYFDVPSDTTTVKFTRIKASDPTAEPFNKSVNTDLPVNPNLSRFELWNSTLSGEQEGAWVGFPPVLTTIVANFAATIDTSAEACVKANAEAAITAYNALSTFEQNQFDVLDVGGGVTGLQRLKFLKDFYNIETSLNVSPFGFQDSSKYSWLVIGIGTLGVFALLSYFFVTKKKHYN